MKGIGIHLCALSALLAFGACDKDTKSVEDIPVAEEKTQTFRLRVESVGEDSKLDTRVSRPLFSISPRQTIDRVTFIILRNDVSAEILMKRTITGWSDTDNIISQPYTERDTRGREANIRLEGDELLPDGDYVVYAVGAHTGSFSGYEAFAGYEVGDAFLRAETATVADDGIADEIFAGAEYLHVVDGKIWTRPSIDADYEAATFTLRRQVAGMYGYFTHIPAEIGGEKVAKLRLVVSKRNRQVVFGGFCSMEDPENFSIEKVVNGVMPRTDYDSRLAGSETKNGFATFEIALKDWFPGAGDLPLDANGDGFLDENDENWQVDEEVREEGTVKLQKGSVYRGGFWVPIYVTAEEVKTAMPTFQLQLLGRDDRILKYWNVLKRPHEEETTRSIVYLNEQGRAVVQTETDPSSALTYNIARNNLYTLGTKDMDQSYGEDNPIDLSSATDLVMDVNPEWTAILSVIFN